MLFCPGRYSIFVAKFSYSLSYNVLANNILVVDITSNDERDKTVFALIHLVYFYMRIPIKDQNWITAYYRYRFFSIHITHKNRTRE